MKESEWQEKYGHEWQDATRKQRILASKYRQGTNGHLTVYDWERRYWEESNGTEFRI